jgi:ubiquinone/menaquinone biosynthesis C-methylase UbiE
MSSHSERVERLFDVKARGWAQKYDEAGALAARLERFGRAVARLAPPSERARVLDFGCGTGDLAAHLARAGFRVTGIDIAKAMLDGARARFPDAATWIALSRDWSRLPFDDAAFDAVTASSVLEYVPRLDVLFAELARVCRPGGVFVATVPNIDDRTRRFESALGAARPPAALRALLPGAVRRYMEYLELSRNRLPLEVWISMAQLAGFDHDPAASEPEGPLSLLAFRRR